MMRDSIIIYDEILDGVKEEIKSEIQTSLPAKITQIDHINGYCTCEILAQLKRNGEAVKFPLLVDVMLDYQVFGDFKVTFPREINDLVWLGFSKYHYDNLLENLNGSVVNSEDVFSLNGAYILRSIKLDTENFTAGTENDLYIENSVNGTVINIKGTGEIFIKPGTGFINVEGIVKADDFITNTGDVSLKNHVHSQGVDSNGDAQVNTNPPL